MSLKRLLSFVVLAGLAAVVLVSAAPAGSIDDGDPCPRSGADLLCPAGTEGVPYSIRFHGDEEPICAPGDDKWYAKNGALPPGLTLSTDGTLSGTPTAAGSYAFWLHLELPDYWNGTSGCSSHDNSQERVVIAINPGVAKLTIGPEQVGVPVGTVNTAYSLQMTATVADPKTWSVVSGALPPGLAIDAASGLISGTPTAAGTFGFTVRAAVNGDSRSDTKALVITIRAPVTLSRSSAPLVSEVGLDFSYAFVAAGGTEQYTWALASGALPLGIELSPTGELAGVPEEPGRFPFAVTVTDTEGSVGMFSGRLLVADTLTVFTTQLRPGKVGRLYRARLRATGGVKPSVWRIMRGPLPRGVRFDRQLGRFVGLPRKAGRYRLVVEVTDALRVKDRATLVLVVAAEKKSKKPKKN